MTSRSWPPLTLSTVTMTTTPARPRSRACCCASGVSGGGSPSSTWRTSRGRRRATSPSSRPAARGRAARWCCAWRRRSTSRSPTATGSCSRPVTPPSTTTPGTRRGRPGAARHARPRARGARPVAGARARRAVRRAGDEPGLRPVLALIDADLLDPPVNVVRATLHPRGLARSITNLAAWRAHLLRQVRRHLAATPADAALAALLAEASAYPVGRPTPRPAPGPDLRVAAGAVRRRRRAAALLDGVDVRHPAGRRRQRAGRRDLPPGRRGHPSVAVGP